MHVMFIGFWFKYHKEQYYVHKGKHCCEIWNCQELKRNRTKHRWVYN